MLPSFLQNPCRNRNFNRNFTIRFTGGDTFRKDSNLIADDDRICDKIDIKSFTTSYGADRAKTRGAIYSKSIAKDNKKMIGPKSIEAQLQI